MDYEQTKTQRIKIFQKEMKQFLLTSRFTNSTLMENRKYKEKNNLGCIYCSPDPITKKIPNDAVVFVLEMNNESNTIEGLSLIHI